LNNIKLRWQAVLFTAPGPEGMAAWMRTERAPRRPAQAADRLHFLHCPLAGG
jgi:hypothetical protein